MISNLDSVLEDCLQRLDQGETLQACLSRYPERAVELRPLLHAAAQLEKQAQLRPSAAFKARTRTQLYAHMDAHPRKSRQRWKPSLSIPRLAFGLASLLVAFALTGTALAQSALPGAAFYRWKLASEQVWRAVSPDPVGVDLSLAERRVDEAVAVSGDATAQEIAMKEYRRVITDLGKYQGSAVQSRIRQSLVIQQQRLKSTGLLPMDEETPIPTNVILPTQIPSSTQEILPLPKQTLMPSALVPTNLLPTVLPTIIKMPTIVFPTKMPLPTMLPTIMPPLPTVLPTIIPPLPTALPTIIPPLPTKIPGLP